MSVQVNAESAATLAIRVNPGPSARGRSLSFPESPRRGFRRWRGRLPRQAAGCRAAEAEGDACRRATIEALAQAYLDALQALIAHQNQHLNATGAMPEETYLADLAALGVVFAYMRGTPLLRRRRRLPGGA